MEIDKQFNYEVTIPKLSNAAEVYRRFPIINLIDSVWIS